MSKLLSLLDMTRGVCQDDPEAWQGPFKGFKGPDGYNKRERAALDGCHRCPVEIECDEAFTAAYPQGGPPPPNSFVAGGKVYMGNAKKARTPPRKRVTPQRRRRDPS